MDHPASTAAHAAPRAEDLGALNALRQDRIRAYTDGAWLGVLVSGSVGAMAVLSLGVDAVAAAVWGGCLAAVLGLRLVLARAGPADPVARLRGFRAVTLLHGAAWGALPWLGPGPAGIDAVATLLMLQAGVAVGGMMLLLYDRRAALAFALAVFLPLIVRMALWPGPTPLVAHVAAAMVLLLVAALWVTALRADRERVQLARARLAKADQVAETRHADALLQRVFDHAGEGICVFDARLRLLAMNRQMAWLLGLDDDVLTEPGTPLRNWVLYLARRGEYGAVDPEAEADRRLADVRRPQRSVAQRRRANGRTIETRRTPLPEGGFVMVCVDITDRLASEEALFENRRTLDVLLENTEEGFWFIDNEQRTTDANRAMCRMLGVSREQMLGHTIFDFVDAENEAIFRQQVARRTQGQASSYEITLTRPDGTQVHCYNNGTPIHDAMGRKIGAIGLFSDITQSRQAAADAQRASALAAQKSVLLETTLQSLSQGVLSIGADMRVNAWNQRLVDLLQVPESFLQTAPTLREVGQWQVSQGVFGPDMTQLVGRTEREGLQRYLAGDDGAVTSALNYRRTRADGTVIEVRSHFPASGGQVRTYTDVTDQTAAHDAMLAAKEQAERANRAKSEFLSRMSHELRTPLNAILGFAQLLQRDTDEPLQPGQQVRVDQVLRGGRHLLVLINEVLDLARIEAGTLPLHDERVDVAELLGDCLRLVQPMAHERQVALVVVPPQSPVGTVTVDPTRLRQVMLNLLSNAIKYNREGGQVRLSHAVQGTGADAQVRIEVHDEGPGLSAEQQQRLFQAFERLDADASTVEGAGIGLALCRSLVGLMHGSIGVHSTPGHGSSFWVLLPRGNTGDERPAAEAPATLAVALPADAAEATPATRRVLYIEDNPVNQVLMQGMLAFRPEIDLQLADRPETGLHMAEQTPPDLILLDIQLPGMSGFEVLQALRRMPGTSAVPVIAVSANAMPEDLDQARRAGFDDYITKPLDLPRLLEAVGRALNSRTDSAGVAPQ